MDRLAGQVPPAFIGYPAKSIGHVADERGLAVSPCLHRCGGGVALRTSIHSGEQSGFVHDEMGNTAERESWLPNASPESCPCWHGGASGAWGGAGCWSPPRGRELLLAIRQLGFPLQAGGVDLGRDAVRDMRAQPGDCGDLVLDTGRGVGQLGELVMLAFGRQG